MRIVISGGGTGGHVFPAIAIADALKKRDKKIEILFVGAKGKLEMQKVPAAGYPIKGLWISGFQRKLTLRNVLFPLKLVVSMFNALWILIRFKPNVAVGVGGYASGPILKSAHWLGIPTVIQEQNSYAGVTNRILAKKSRKICVAYPDMGRYFDKEKIAFTGNPVREEIVKKDIETSDAKDNLGLDRNKKTVLIVGGSLGARSLNEAIRNNKDFWAENPEVQLFWQVGKLYYEDYKNSEVARMPNVNVVAFVEDMAMAYSAADLIVCRAGALTISELAIVKKPAILVPSPNVAEDHQTKNAMALVRENAAWMCLDSEVSEKLPELLSNILFEKGKNDDISVNLEKFAKPNAAEHITEIILDIIDQK